MNQPLGTLARTHSCGGLTAADVSHDVVLLGWVDRVRDLGSLVFIDVRDRHGITQIVVRDDESLVAEAGRLRAEFVVAVLGHVERRSPETINPKMKTGEIEVAAREIRLLNDAKTPPFPISDETPVSEDTRLKYRYLDLRRPRMQRNIALRHRATMEIRRYFDEQGFLEIETPMLTKSTPEGARDYLVPSRVHPGEFYALPQSPQIFKQILMISGMDRYFQIVKCFRDEDLRADRQPEFTQVDLEISFATEDLVFATIEPLMERVMAMRRGPSFACRTAKRLPGTAPTSRISGSAWRSATSRRRSRARISRSSATQWRLGARFGASRFQEPHRTLDASSTSWSRRPNSSERRASSGLARRRERFRVPR
jgi:aspartyl-tRNA synthetase